MNLYKLLLMHSVNFLTLGEKLTILKTLELEDLLKFNINDWEKIIFRKIVHRTKFPDIIEKIDKEINYLEKKEDVYVISLFDDIYPKLLRKIEEPPLLIFYRGKLPDDDKKLVSIVGTRKASRDALEFTFSLAKNLSDSSVGVVSGLALGVDAKAHQGTLSNEYSTWAVLGNGIDTVLPSSNREIAFKILEMNGGIISEYPPFTGAMPYHFPRRNRIIAGMSAATIIIQAGKTSGSLITLESALNEGREIFVWDGNSMDGARTLINDLPDCSFKSYVDILDKLNIEPKELEKRTNTKISNLEDVLNNLKNL